MLNRYIERSYHYLIFAPHPVQKVASVGSEIPQLGQKIWDPVVGGGVCGAGPGDC